ncbi:MAG: ATP-binding cassette domain-containing protein [Anaerolineaceae bacterium]
MPAINVTEITKSFGSVQAVNGVSFEVQQGEIFGLLGPNGAGKTTSIRMILDIFKPDSGSISVLGGAMNEAKKDRIGYLPEERGLYQDIPLERCLTYLASLKGMEMNVIRKRLNEYLERFDLVSSRKKKVKELSKGMQQKAQLITTLIHEPDLIIIDEPFSALDPVNTQMVRELLMEQRDMGRAIVMCTHQMHQVEELCDRLVLIDKGKTVLYGNIHDVRKQFAKREIIVWSMGEFPSHVNGVREIKQENHELRLRLDANANPQDILKDLVNSGVVLEHFEIAMPTLDEIFIQVVQGEETQA